MRRFVSRQLLLVFLIGLASVTLAGCSLPGQKEFSGLEVKTTDGTTTQVYLDELHLGQAPLEKRDIQPGTYTLRLEPELAEKQPYETQVHLYPGTLTSVLWNFSGNGTQPAGSGEILELEPLASEERAELSVITVPEGAKISLNTQSYGLSPVVVDSVEPGQYTLTVDAVAHNKKAFAVQIQPGYRLHVFSRLTKEAAALDDAAAAPTTTATNAAQLTDSGTTNGSNLEEIPAADTSGARRQIPTNSPTPNASPIPTTASGFTNLEPPYVTITETGTGWLRVRSQASSAGEEVGRVDVGSNYPYVSSVNGWYEIEYAPGESGWISGQYTNIIR